MKTNLKLNPADVSELQAMGIAEAARQSAPTPHWITLTVLYVGVGTFWVWMIVTIADSIF